MENYSLLFTLPKGVKGYGQGNEVEAISPNERDEET